MFLHEFETKHGSRSDRFYLVPIGDVHLGARACDTDALKTTIEWVRKTPGAYWIGMGDQAEHICPGDKRFDLKTLDPKFLPSLDDLPNRCLKELVLLFQPIKSKCLGLLTGNHEETLRLRNSHDIHGALCVALNAKNLGYDSLIRWTFRRGNNGKNFGPSVITLFASHSTISGRRDGAKVNRMLDVSRNFDADLYLFGHGHAQVAARSVELGLPASGALKLRERLRLVCMTGTYRRTYAEGTLDYSEKGGFAPTPIGSPRIEIRPWASARERFAVTIL
jgi:hypothetical protein